MLEESIIGVPVAFVPWVAEGRLGFCPAPGRWHLDVTLEPERLLDESSGRMIANQHSGRAKLASDREILERLIGAEREQPGMGPSSAGAG